MIAAKATRDWSLLGEITDILLPDELIVLAMTVRVYGDISGTERSHVIVAAGYIGRRRNWRNVAKQWRAALPAGVDHFHTTDFYAGRGAFDGWDIKSPEHLALITRLTEIPRVKENRLLGFAFGIDTRAFALLVKPELEQIDAPRRPVELRVFAVAAVLQQVAVFLRERPPAAETARRVVIFEHEQGFGKVIDYYKWCRQQREPWAVEFEDFYTGEKRKLAPLQLADLLAYEGWKRGNEHIAANPRPVRKSFESMRLNGGIELKMMDENNCRTSADSLRAWIKTHPDGLARTRSQPERASDSSASLFSEPAHSPSVP